MLRAFLAGLAVCLAAAPDVASAAPSVLAQSPTLGGDQIVFTHGGYLWSVPRTGGVAKRLTKGGSEGRAYFSPDGKWIAYTSRADRNDDVYVMPAQGGEARRLTWHPGADVAVGWTPDSKQVLLASSRDAFSFTDRLYTVPVEGGAQAPLPMWRGETGSYSPDGQRIAYVPNAKWQKEWKRYRGGQATPIYVADLKDLKLEKVPRNGSNDSNPVWAGDKVYFLSDRDGPVTLFAYDTRTRAVRKLLANDGLDFKSLSGGPDALVYEQFGEIRLYSPADGKVTPVEVRIDEQLPALQPQTVKLGTRIFKGDLSPKGDAVAFEARGDIVTVGVADGGARNLTATDGVAEREPAWSPDGSKLAYFSDASGEYALNIRGADGAVRSLAMGPGPRFYKSPLWSPDGARILFEDAGQALWIAELATGKMSRIAAETYSEADFSPTWSPDSRWVAYTRQGPNFMGALELYSVDPGRTIRVTDGMADVRHPVFDKGGRFLVFTASTDLGLGLSPQDLSGLLEPVSRNLYALLLRRDDQGPASGPAQSAGPFRIDLDGLSDRIAPMPAPAANYTGLQAAAPGVLIFSEAPAVTPQRSQGQSVGRIDIATGKVEKLNAGVASAQVSEDGDKILYRTRMGFVVASASAAPKAGEGLVDIAKMEARIDPRAEWRQMYAEVWRQERDYFYDPKLHGMDLDKIRARYAPYVDALGSREDLNTLFREMLGELTVGHMFVGEDGRPPTNGPRGGLLGADYGVESGRYRFTRILKADPWAPSLDAPLDKPGLGVRAGDYLLAVNGRDLTTATDLYSLFQDTAGKAVRIKVGASSDGVGARELTVTPIADERELRLRNWEEDNRRKVEAASGGRLAYVHLPDTKYGATANFTRFYYAQAGREGVILDGRFNQGGRLADEVIDRLKRPLRNCTVYRYGEDNCTPNAQIYGPKTMITNEMSGSGGEALPWMFRQDKVGPIVGARTWGGITAGAAGPLIDGGGVATPSHGSYGASGRWDIENRGITPDVEVENDPASVAAGRDPQLEKAIEITLDALKRNPPKRPVRPPFPTFAKTK